MFEVYDFTSVAVHNHAMTRPSCMLSEELRKEKTHGATSARTPVCELCPQPAIKSFGVEASVKTAIKSLICLGFIWESLEDVIMIKEKKKKRGSSCPGLCTPWTKCWLHGQHLGAMTTRAAADGRLRAALGAATSRKERKREGSAF